MGMLEAAKAVASGTPLQADERMRRALLCRQCQFRDSKGETLFRKTKLVGTTCGSLFTLQDELRGRDEKKEGCGCILELKWAYAEQHCPHNVW